MNRKLIIGSLVLVFCSTGCSPLYSDMEGKITDKLIERLLSDEDYAEYIRLKEDGRLDANGHYIDDTPDASPDTAGKVHVTFAENTYLNIRYYHDAELTEPIETESCYLDADDCIYASEPAVRDGCSSAYHFSTFRVWKYDADGKRIGELHTDSTEKHLVLQIPMDSGITEISIEPIGMYEGRSLTLEDYYVDENGEQQRLAGMWNINDASYTGDNAQISATIPYSVVYQYDAGEYFFVSSQPEAFSLNPSSGVVNFHKSADLYETEQYTVQLHPYITAVTNAGENHIRSAMLNGTKTAFPCKLQFGDILMLETELDYRLSCNQLRMSEPEKLSSGYRFTVQITEDISAEQIRFESRAWSSKDIPFDVPKASIWEKITGLFSDRAEDTLLTVRSGEKVLTYKELKNGKNVTLEESEKLEIAVGEEIKDSPNLAFVVSVNGANPVYITKASEQKKLSLQYDAVESVKITVEKGFVFSSANIDNGNLQVQYLLDKDTKVREGQFLPEGTQVIVKVTCPPGTVVTGGAVNAGCETGSVMISESTRSADFVVNSAADDGR